MISLIWAMDKNRVIGKDNQMPWHHPSDLKYFKEVTHGKKVVMGRLTFESILSYLKKPLPNRESIVLTRQDISFDGAKVVNDFNELITEYKDSEEEVFIIGGKQIYDLFLPVASKLYITHIDESYVGDTYFSEFDENEYQKIKEINQGVLSWCVYEKVK
jgi:dihydrofolate reductase